MIHVEEIKKKLNQQKLQTKLISFIDANADKMYHSNSRT